MKQRLLVWFFLTCSILLFAIQPARAAGLTGSIFTGLNDGSSVNGNIYEDCGDVFLNGGPPPNAPAHAAGLPNGDYYFQVTDPAGSVLLSTDDISQRIVTVAGGVFSSHGGNHVVGVGSHAGSISVQLLPFDETPNNGGEYKVWITPVGNYAPLEGVFGFVPGKTKTDNFKCRHEDGPPEEVDTPTAITGLKFYDANPNGIQEPGEIGIAGVRISYSYTDGVTEVTGVTETGTSGAWSVILPVGTLSYRACELMPVGPWVQTAPLPNTPSYNGMAWADGDRCWTGTVTPNVDVTGLDFGNVVLGAGGGHTLGFWSNKNGQALFGADDLALLVALNLRSANGTHFDPGNYAAYRTWSLSATANNMAYMLSAQLAAMSLNVLNGKVSGESLVYSPTLGFMTVNALTAAANTELGLNGITVDAGPNRNYQEALKTAIDQANNNLNFVQPGPIPVVY